MKKKRIDAISMKAAVRAVTEKTIRIHGPGQGRGVYPDHDLEDVLGWLRQQIFFGDQVDRFWADFNSPQQWQDVDLGLHSGETTRLWAQTMLIEYRADMGVGLPTFIPAVPTNTPTASSTWLTTSSPSLVAPSHPSSSESTLFSLPLPALSLSQPAAAPHSNPTGTMFPLTHAEAGVLPICCSVDTSTVPSQGSRSRWSWGRILGRSQSMEDLNEYARRNNKRLEDVDDSGGGNDLL